MMSKDVLHPVSEFKDLPWDNLKPNRCSRDWTFGVGMVNHFGDNVPYINIVEKDLSSHIWELPKAFTAIFHTIEKMAANSVRNQISKALETESALYE